MKPLISIAPMFKVTNRHYRYLMRLISKQCKLYTEMYVDRQIIHSEKPLDIIIGGFKGESGTVIQIAGNNPDRIYNATKICSEYGYNEINLNCGCPSERAIDRHGVILMKDPPLTKALCSAMVEAIGDNNVKLSVKCRNGVDDLDSFEDLDKFISITSESGIKDYIIHSRKAILGLKKTRKNLIIPKIDYSYVYRLIEQYNHLNFTINGAIQSPEDIKEHISKGAVGVMVGRAVQSNPWNLYNLEKEFYDVSPPSKVDILTEYINHIREFLEIYKEHNISEKRMEHTIILPIISAANGLPGASLYRRTLSRKDISLIEKLEKSVEQLKNVIQ